MREAINQHSFVIGGAVVLLVAVLVLRGRSRWIRRPVLLALVVGLAGFFFLMRPGGGDVTSAQDLDAALASGRPVVLEFFSNY